MTQICCADLLCGWKRYWSLSLDLMYFFPTIVFGFLSIKFSWKRAGPSHWYSRPSERIEPSEDIPEGQTLFWRIVFQTSFHEINVYLIRIPIFILKTAKTDVYGFKNWDNTEKGSTEKKERNRSWKDNKDTAIRKTFPINRRTVFIWKHLYHDGNVRTSRRQDWHDTKNTF